MYRSNRRIPARERVLSNYFLTRPHDELLGQQVVIDMHKYAIIRLEPIPITGEVLVRLRDVKRPLLIRKTSLHLLASLVS